MAARRSDRPSPPGPWFTSRMSSTITGKMAHALHTPANPNATPPPASRRPLLVRWSPSSTASAPARQNSTSHGSISTVCAA